MPKIELELPGVVSKRRAYPSGKLVTLNGGEKVRVTLLEDGETIEIYSEGSLILAPITGNVIHLKLRQIDEVE